MRNSNHRLCQITLLGEIIEEEKFYVIGFISYNDPLLQSDTWFIKLDSRRVDLVDQLL